MPAEALVYDAIRTPRGRGDATGSLHTTKPIDLVTGLLTELTARNAGLDPGRLDDVLLGVASPVRDQGGDLARIAVLAAGFPDTVPGLQPGRLGGSGLEAVHGAAQQIRSGWADLVLAGGVESASRVPPGSDGGAWSADPATSLATRYVPAAVAADLLATIEGFSRAELDAHAVRSHRSAARAALPSPVRDLNGAVLLDHDEVAGPGITAEMLAALPPSAAAGPFDAVALQKYHWIGRLEHLHTTGNSAPAADGAALVLLGNAAIGDELGLTPRARVLAAAVAGSDPTLMLAGAVPAARKALRMAGIEPSDLDLVEVDEPFAAVALHVIRQLGVDPALVNTTGGAIALGRPAGAIGAVLLGTLVDELVRTGGRYGLCAVTAGAGMGLATIVERL